MKTILAISILFCAAAAFGQAGGSISSQPQVIQVPDHPQHAAPHALAEEQSLIGGSSANTFALHGDRPLWEFGPVKEEPSLGDVARAYRKEKETGKKADLVFEKQGS